MNRSLDPLWLDTFDRASRSYPREPPVGEFPTARAAHWLHRELQPVSRVPHRPFEHSLGGVFLQSRTSHLPQKMPPLDAALDLLSAMSMVREFAFDEFGREWQSRLAPSAGGTHSIESLLWYGSEWYVSHLDAVSQVRIPFTLVDTLVTSVRKSSRNERARSAIFAVADIRFISERYPTGDSLLWRDAGSYLTTCQLAAMSLALPTTILGLSGPVDPDSGVFTVGALLLGIDS